MPTNRTPVAAGLAVVADNTGRVLMIQRPFSGDDPNGGKWEFPGGKLNDGELPHVAAVREWQEETGLNLPARIEQSDGLQDPSEQGQIYFRSEWTSPNGKYQGYVVHIPQEDQLDLSTRADDPDGGFTVVAWVNPEDLPQHNLRPELLDDVDDVLAQITKWLLRAVQKSGTCKPGQTVAQTDCTPVSGGGQRESAPGNTVKIDQTLPTAAKQLMAQVANQLRNSAHLSPAQRVTYFNAFQTGLQRMTDAALTRFTAGLTGEVKFFANLPAIKEALAEQHAHNPATAEKIRRAGNIGGCYSKSGGKASLFLDGGYVADEELQPESHRLQTAADIYCHEFAHSIDGPSENYSRSPEWLAAYQKEIAGGKLTKYATTHPAEGFAEFGRLVLNGRHDSAKVRQAFPQCWALWEKWGLAESTPKGTKAMSRNNDEGIDLQELFGERVDLGDAGHLDIMADNGDENTVDRPVQAPATRLVNRLKWVGKAKEGAEDEEGTVEERADLIATILMGVYGDEQTLDFVDQLERSSVSKAWEEIDHPRGENGRFIRRNSPAALSAATKKINAELKNPDHTPEGLKSLTESMSILTVAQLRKLAKKFDIGPGRNDLRVNLRDRIASRLSRGRRQQQSTGPDQGGASGGSSGGVNRLVTARPEQTAAKAANTGLVPEDLRQHLTVKSADGSVSDHQLVGAAKAIEALDTKGSFLLADGAGAGKTRQMLAVAEDQARKGKKVILIAPAGIIKDKKTGGIVGSVGKDAQAMGISLTPGFHKGAAPKPGKVQVSTYEQLADLRNRIDKDTVVIFDEAHGLKNATSARAKFGREVMDKAGGVMLGTATPADQIEDLGYLFRTSLEPPPWESQVANLKKTMRKSAVDGLKITAEVFDKLTETGAMIKREISLDNVEVGFDNVDLGSGAAEELAKLAGATPKDRAQALMRQRFAQERLKIPHAVKTIQEELAQGRQVVVFMAGVSSSEGDVTTVPTPTQPAGETGGTVTTPKSEGNIAALRRALREAGVPNDHITELHGGEGGEGKDAVSGFQSGKHKVIITTAQSGGTGHNLDDADGKAPRTQVVVTAPFSAIDNAQMWGRTHRLTTKSKSRMRYLFADTEVDNWNKQIISDKVSSLSAIVAGEASRQTIPSKSIKRQMKLKVKAPLRNKGLVKPTNRLKASFFETCNRGETRRCKPVGTGGSSGRPTWLSGQKETTGTCKPGQRSDLTGCTPASGGGGVQRPDTTSEGSQRSRLLSAAGSAIHAAGEVEHKIKEVVGHNFSKLPAPVQKAVIAVLKVAFAPFTAGQAMAERVAKERGMTPEQAEQLRGTLATIDLVAFKSAKVSALAGMPGAGTATLVSGIVPVASVGYLAYSTAQDLPATYRAVKGLAKDAVANIRERLARKLTAGSNSTDRPGRPVGPSGPTGYKPSLEQVGRSYAKSKKDWQTVVNEREAARLADALAKHSYDDWYFAALTAALEETNGDVDIAILAANEMYKQKPVTKVLSPANRLKQLITKGKGTCKPGQTAAQTDCTPASGEGGGGAKESAAGKPKKAAPGSQLPPTTLAKLKELGADKLPPADVPVSEIKINLNAGDSGALMTWKQKSRSGRVSQQSAYTAAFHAKNAEVKWDRVERIEPVLKDIEAGLSEQMQDINLPQRKREAAAITSCIRETGLRPTDSAESIRHGHFGISSLQGRHVKIKGDEVHLDFIGKEGVRNRTIIRDPVNVDFIKEAMKSTGPKDFLFKEANSGDAIKTLREISVNAGGPEDILVKDLRTVNATRWGEEAVRRFKGPPPPLTGDQKKDSKAIAKAILTMSGNVSRRLNNNPEMARDNYIHPRVFKKWLSTLQSAS